MASASSSSTKIGSYPHPATLNGANFVSIKPSQSNFLLWKTQIMVLIESQDMTGFIDGEFPTPTRLVSTSIAKGADDQDVVNPDYIKWRRSDRLLGGWITGKLSDEILRMVVSLDTSRDVWLVLHHFTQVAGKRILSSSTTLVSPQR
ncbi:hypothetical protein AAC387_Pa10g0313 [Persea americana]